MADAKEPTEIGEYIRSAREEAGLSLEDLSRKLNDEDGLLAKVEAGEAQPKHAFITHACQLLGVSVPKG